MHTLAKESRALADAARLSGLKMTRFSAWLFDAFSSEVSAPFEKAATLQTSVTLLPTEYRGGTIDMYSLGEYDI